MTCNENCLQCLEAIDIFAKTMRSRAKKSDEGTANYFSPTESAYILGYKAGIRDMTHRVQEDIDVLKSGILRRISLNELSRWDAP